MLEGLSDFDVVSGSCGKNHTVIGLEDGRSFACGANSMGQCGIGDAKKDKMMLLTPVQALVSDCSNVVCGSEFTVWLCDGKLFAAGSPQYGVLGDGSNHEYNANDSEPMTVLCHLTQGCPLGSVKMKFDPEPTPKLIKALENREIKHVIAGSFHIMAVDSDGIPYTWGNGQHMRYI